MCHFMFSVVVFLLLLFSVLLGLITKADKGGYTGPHRLANPWPKSIILTSQYITQDNTTVMHV